MNEQNEPVVRHINDFRQAHVLLATWFGCGLMKPAPGTWGTLGGLPFALLALVWGGWPGLLVFLVAVTGAGFWAIGKFEKNGGNHDPSFIVIDEVAGLALAFLLYPSPEPITLAATFVLFRLFDILKPWPVSWADAKVKGAAGVILDDLIAGAMAAATVWVMALLYLWLVWKPFS